MKEKVGKEENKKSLMLGDKRLVKKNADILDHSNSEDLF